MDAPGQDHVRPLAWPPGQVRYGRFDGSGVGQAPPKDRAPLGCTERARPDRQVPLDAELPARTIQHHAGPVRMAHAGPEQRLRDVPTPVQRGSAGLRGPRPRVLLGQETVMWKVCPGIALHPLQRRAGLHRGPTGRCPGIPGATAGKTAEQCTKISVLPGSIRTGHSLCGSWWT